MLSAVAPVISSGANWALVSTVSNDEAFAPLAQMRDLILAVSAATLLLAALVGWLFRCRLPDP